MKIESTPIFSNIPEKTLSNDKNLREYVDFVAASRLSLSYDKPVNSYNVEQEREALLSELGFSAKENKEQNPLQAFANRAIEKEYNVKIDFRVQRQDPLVLDLDRDGIFSFSNLDQGKLFDINADGKLDRSVFVTEGDAFLALDLNKNGRIEDGKELFGDQNGAINGFLELQKYDENQDGVIDKEDDIFDSLLAFGTDFLEPLDAFDVTSISLDYFTRNEDISSLVTLTERSVAQYEKGEIDVADALVSFRRVA